MSIEFKCSGCGNSLRVQDEQAGRQAKCPVCNQLTTIPFASEAAADSEPFHESSQQPDTQLDPAQSARPASAAEGTPPGMRPHRGGTILVFGVCSLLCCGLLGIAAWLMANEDLSLMDRGLMDPAGRGMTMAGKVLGILALILFLAATIVPMILR